MNFMYLIERFGIGESIQGYSRSAFYVAIAESSRGQLLVFTVRRRRVVNTTARSLCRTGAGFATFAADGHILRVAWIVTVDRRYLILRRNRRRINTARIRPRRCRHEQTPFVRRSRQTRSRIGRRAGYPRPRHGPATQTVVVGAAAAAANAV